MKRVVVAEASPTIKSVADSLLRQNGYDVVCTSDGLQAWEVISSEKPDMVLVGIGLSGLNGLELCRQITTDRITGGIPVVMMLGQKDLVSDEEIVSSGARGKLRKPFSPKDLLEVVNKLTGAAPVPLNTPEKNKAGSDSSQFITQVASTQHLHRKDESFNLEWLDLNQTPSTESFLKATTFDVNSEEQSLIIDEDQYGLANPLPVEPEKIEEERRKDEDYDWFVGEIKKEIDGKPKPEKISSNDSVNSLFNSPAPPDLKFDDIKPSESSRPPGLVRGFPEPERVSSFPKNTELQGAFRVEPGQLNRNLSDEEIALLADRVAMKLATHIASKIDKSQILEAIRQVLKS
jgi:CheY-like chemotaxis protein